MLAKLKEALSSGGGPTGKTQAAYHPDRTETRLVAMTWMMGANIALNFVLLTMFIAMLSKLDEISAMVAAIATTLHSVRL